MNPQELYQIVAQTMAPGKGVFASDSSPTSAVKNLQKYNIEPTEANLLKYHELFINAQWYEQFISAMIISEPTFWQADSNGSLFRDTLKSKNVLICVKVDGGLKAADEFGGQEITLGLGVLGEKLPKLKENGASLAKWRSLITIGPNKPTQDYLERIASDQAEYALLCQQNGIVPIVEPEVHIKGDHSLEQAKTITTQTLKTVFSQLHVKSVDLKGLILKTSMVLPGSEHTRHATPEEVAQATVAVLVACVPPEVGGVIFLSGGQAPLEAELNFNAIAKKEPLFWELAFSFQRAIEGPPTEIWGGKDENIAKARAELLERLREIVLADSGLLA